MEMIIDLFIAKIVVMYEMNRLYQSGFLWELGTKAQLKLLREKVEIFGL